MKKLIPILLAAFALASCEKDPGMDRSDNEYLVYTNHDASARFEHYDTYYMPDSILVIGDKKDPEYRKDENARQIIDAFAANLNAAGYTRVAEKGKATLGLQLSYVASTYYFTGYYEGNPWWNSYPGYWYPGYWGGLWGGGWYYPYPITYKYSTGSLLADLIDLKTPEGQNEKLPVIWNACIGGLPGGNGNLNVNRTVTAVNQAFAQSPYLKRQAQGSATTQQNPSN